MVHRYGWSGFVAIISFCLVSSTTDAQQVPSVASRLASTSAEEQLEALEEVAEMGPAAAAHVPTVAKLLNSPDLLVKHEAEIALGAIGPAARSAVPELLKLLKGDDLLLKYGALTALRKIGGEHPLLSQSVGALLTDPDRMIRVEAAATVVGLDLGGRKEAIATLAEALSDGRVSIRAAAVPWLCRLGDEAVPALTNVLSSGGVAAQTAAVEALGNMGPRGASAAPQLLELTKSDSATLLSAVAEALGDVQAEPKQALPVLLKLCGHKSAAVRVAALRGIADYGSRASTAVEQLQPLLADDEVMVRLAACDVLAAVGPEAKGAIASLISTLRDQEGAVTLRAAEALGRIGPAAVPALQRLLDDPEYGVLALQTLELMGPAARPAAAEILKHLQANDGLPKRELCVALAMIGADPRTAGPVLKDILKDPKSEGRPAAAFALGRIGDRSAVKDLTNVVEDEDPLVRLGSAWSLLHLDPGNEDYVKIAVPRLIEALERPEPRIRLEAARSLGTLGDQAAPAAAALLKSLGHDESLPVRIASAIALSNLGVAARDSVPQLMALANDESLEGRRTAMFCLGRLGTAATAAVPLLQRFVASEGSHDRVVAAWALLQIQAESNINSALPVILEAIGKERPEVVVQLVHTASRFAAARPEVRQAIESLKDADDPALRAAAAGALDRMTGTRF